VDIVEQYPENSPSAGYVTTYLTPFSLWLAQNTHHLGTTIVAHPGGILDEILYNTRGLDTVVEPTILFIAFAIASYLFRKGS
jgi:energy-converting hydrogenase A subunit F